jgi:pyruvate/2-oxoglutarate dehydrogenase complex dihydrolipoamide dehydrogenase (E3) component
MSTTEHFDAIILGSGQAGNPLASALAQAGKKTAIVEAKHVGGTCINTGCTPTKTMVASARVAYLARRGADFGVHTSPVSVDMAKVRDRKRKIVASFRSGNEKRLKSSQNIELMRGRAAFEGPHSVHVALNDGGERRLEADWIFINTGLRSSTPNVEGIGDVPFLDNESVMELDAVPEHLLVLGGGYIGVEFGQMFRRFGSRVTIVQSGAQLLTQEDPEIAGEVKKILEEDGVQVLLNAKVRGVSKDGSSIALRVDVSGSDTVVSGSHLLVATGRVPNTDALNLAAAGIEANEHGFVIVNERLETNVEGVHALGDVKGGPEFTHISYDDFRIIRANLIEGKSATTAGRMVPYTLYLDPQLGRIGMTEKEARKVGYQVRIARMPMTSVARALEMDETRGTMKVVVDGETNQILGAAVLGVEGGEIASIIQVAMMGKLPYTALRDGIFAHPTLAESLNNLFLKFGD